MEARTQSPRRRGLPSSIVQMLTLAALWPVLALMTAITVEWLGMTWWWPEQGARHSRALLDGELDYLARAARHTLVHDAAAFARAYADALHHVVETTRLAAALDWLRAAPPAQDPLRSELHELYLPFHDYGVAALTITQLFAVRLAVLTLALPVFVLFGLVGLSDGLVERDLRRWGGGRESSWRYHHAKRLVLPLLGLSWLLYLALPFHFPPGVVLVPFAALFGLVVAVMAGTFKKYL